MKKSRSIRKQLNILLACIVFLQTFTIVCALIFSDVFSKLDFEEIRTFTNISEAKSDNLNKSLEIFMVNMEHRNIELSKRISDLSLNSGLTIKEMYNDEELNSQIMNYISDSLVKIVNDMDVTETFVILDNEDINSNEVEIYPSIYFRDNTPYEKNTDNIQMIVGPVSVTQELEISTSSSWIPSFENLEKEETAFYVNPIKAAKEYPDSEILRYGYWSEPFDLFGDGSDVVIYTLPLIDANGEAYGVIGAGVNLNFLSQTLLSSKELYYENSFYMLSDFNGTTLNNNWSIPGNAYGYTNIVDDEEVEVKKTSEDNIYEFNIDSVGKMSCYITPLNLYSDNSPFVNEVWVLSSVVQTSVLNENSDALERSLILSIIITTVITIVVIFIFGYFSTRKLKGLAKHVEELSPLDEVNFEQTGILEIDDLTKAVKIFNDSLIESNNTTSKILELSLLPIGGYEIPDNSQNVKLTDFLYKLLRLESGSIVNKNDWYRYYEKLTCVSHIEYENVYFYLDEIDKREYWLRIKSSKNRNSTIGVVFDVSEDIGENVKLVNKLEHDGLTDLLSQSAFRKNVGTIIDSEECKIGAMLFLDLDNLKYINDNFGHELGDKLILEASKIFKSFEKYNALTSRFSGDEFAVFFYGYDTKQELENIIELIKKESDVHFIDLPNGQSNKIRFSGGVAWYPEDATEVKDLLRLSDFTMLEAKQKEKGSIYQYDQETFNRMSYLIENSELINRLIDEKLIRFAFQPIVNIKTGEIYAYEALMRPLIPEFKSPLDVLSVAEAQSKLLQLDRLILSLVLETMVEKKDIIGDKLIFVNSIPNEAVNESLILNFKEKYPEYFDKIVFEVIEHETRDEKELIKKVNNLKNNGLKIAVDDFGSGYSNELRILKILPDIIKFDMELIQGVHNDKDKQTVVENVLDFCHKRGIEIVAEGVEDREDLEYLINIGADYVQGYYLAKPNFQFIDIPEDKKVEILEINLKK